MQYAPPAAALNGMLRDDALKGKTIIITGGGTGLGKAMGTYFFATRRQFGHQQP